MRILFVLPSSYDDAGRILKASKSHQPARALPYLAALTPRRHDVRIVDETVSDLDLNLDADLVAITGLLRNIPRAVDIARAFRKRGIRTVIGGVAAWALRSSVQSEFDCCVDGEADLLWPEIVADAEQGRLRPHYAAPSHPDLVSLPFPRYDLLDFNRYLAPPNDPKHPITSIETSRGCPRSCSYCLVSRFFGRRMRYRPVGEVVEEIKHHGAKMLFFTDDNLLIEPERALELIRAIRPLGVRWSAQCDALSARRPGLLRAARESGCLAMVVGVESLDPDALRSLDKSALADVSIEELSAAFAEAGIGLIASVMFGLDHDTPSTMEAAVDRLVANRVDLLYPWILTPLPRTPLHERLAAEGRVLHENYSLYDASHVVFQPRNMSPRRLEESFWSVARRFYRSLNALRLVTRPGSSYRFHLAAMHAYYGRLVRAGRHPTA